ncbi:MAG: uroporphyrinogen-III C-methyltransferase [Bacteroidetes bacterium]|nr:uroporphyrinogen-III C-methyltransferase [Bacteroidota bacterium]MBU1373798.1 uroporphyrinogen-III C-methyltransferase [Bacteroidota bacterium]MBU1483845.1 uroporphyrinogen-III C-methyltransferase [Bacteroidota bacterium]MBU1759277.1 uroporphyrinogen-III C-methyltransferase [Bacteroidota bacterium]MBU2045279.1 uroporphyrinogen-III C-methyltransferase [Bacteroidota bacterium]
MILEPKITLVGAGPGDADLISIKGAKALAKAEVVLYDALVNEALLEMAPENSIKIFVGKRAGQHSLKQQEINQLLVDSALRYGYVVRLKGGDPFVFGRGYEEIDFAHSYNIQTEVIPGISSSISVPALQGIPLTHRGTSESFWVITGTKANGEISQDLKVAVKTKATVVILMGVNKIKSIVEIYQKEGLGRLPVAIIQNGSTPKEKAAVGVINTIIEQIEEQKIAAPAVIVIGEVVSLHPLFQPILASYEFVDAE